MTSRVVIGALPGGGFGMRSSLPGVNVLGINDDNDTGLSFSSGWSDIAKIHMTGVAAFAREGTTVAFGSTGFIPYVDVRPIAGGTLFDDHNIATGENTDFPIFNTNGYASNIAADSFVLKSDTPTFGSFITTMFYVVYRIPV